MICSLLDPAHPKFPPYASLVLSPSSADLLERRQLRLLTSTHANWPPFTPEIKEDSAIRIRYLHDGKTVTCDGDVYFAVNMHVRVEAEIGSGVCHVVDVTTA